MFKNVASQKVVLYAYNSTTGAPVTGLTTGATFAPYVSINGAAPAALGTTTVTELDATNLPGWYAVQPSQGETNGDMLLFGGKSSTSNVYINGFPIFTDPPNYTTASIDGNGRIDVIKIAGTTQTARDIGASVLLSTGTGTGQLDFTSGVVKSNLVQILATALTETAGLLAGGFKKFFNVAAPTLTCLGVDQTGDNFARLGAPAGASVSADVAAVKSDTGTILTDVNSGAGAIYTRIGAPAGASIAADIAAVNAKTTNLPAAPASTTNITAASGVALTSAYDFAKGTVAMTESYAANGVAPTPVQALMAIHQDAMQFGISGVNYTVKKLDNSTTAFIKTLDSAVTPTAAVRT